jgi:hypothetical protein
MGLFKGNNGFNDECFINYTAFVAIEHPLSSYAGTGGVSRFARCSGFAG